MIKYSDLPTTNVGQYFPKKCIR